MSSIWFNNNHLEICSGDLNKIKYARYSEMTFTLRDHMERVIARISLRAESNELYMISTQPCEGARIIFDSVMYERYKHILRYIVLYRGKARGCLMVDKNKNITQFTSYGLCKWERG